MTSRSQLSDRGDPLGAERDRLFALAYRMLGSVADADDILQEASMRLASARPIASKGAWLTTVVTRLCLDQLRSCARQREVYVGPWLPEPLTVDIAPASSQEEQVGLSESVSTAFMVLLERLSPLERAAFVLHEVFGASHSEVAGVLGREEPACRQLVHRARAHVAAGRRRFEPSDEVHARILGAFLNALATGDAAALEALLVEDVIAITDGGGKVKSARRPVLGRSRVARFLVGLARKYLSNVQAQVRTINAQPGLVLRAPQAVAIVVLDIADGCIRTVFLQRNPEKLRLIR